MTRPVGRVTCAVTATAIAQVVVYWRPSCPYCSRLRRQLRQLGVRSTEIDIWADPSAAATVRAYAAGNETVPTVVIGDVAMVNPSGPAVVDAVRRLAPHALGDAPLPAPPKRQPPARLVAGWVAVMALVAASFGFEAAGYATLSWVLDGAAVAGYLAVRAARWRPSGLSGRPR